MPNAATGQLSWTSDGPAARITIKGKKRETFLLLSCRTEAEAQARCQLLAELAQRFRRAGVIETRDARELLKTAAACAPAMLAGVRQVAGELCGGELIDTKAPRAPSFQSVAGQWTGGELHRRYPDHVKAKDSELDEARLKLLCEIDVGGVKLGDIPVDEFTLDHAEEAMRKLPARAKRPATRRQYAQLIQRVLALAVYPLRLLKAHPLPRGFMPKSGKPPAFPYLYPDEDAALLSCTTIPLDRRVLWGVLAREGARSGEAVALQVGIEVDLLRGVCSLDKNKTDDPRAWALDPDVTEALRRHVAERGAKRGDALFLDEGGHPFENDKLAERLRDDLRLAGVDRPELFNAGENTGKLRAHDLRGTFVTLSLANGRTEAWVQDRTGHTTSAMLNRYRRAARSASELGLGTLVPLSKAIPEFADGPAMAQQGGDDGPESSTKLAKLETQAEVAEPADAADSKSVSFTGVWVRLPPSALSGKDA
jgi:integrase